MRHPVVAIATPATGEVVARCPPQTNDGFTEGSTDGKKVPNLVTAASGKGQAQPAQRPVDHGQPLAAASGGRQGRPELVRVAREAGCLLCPLSSAETRHLVSPTNKGRGGIDAMIVQRWERSPETSVNILSYADFHQHDRSFVWGCPGLESGVDLTIGHKGNSGIPLAVAPPPPLHET